jgi:hypothetical protein
MTYYLLLFILSLVASFFLRYVQSPFFKLALSSTALLNDIIDTEINEDDKQKLLISGVKSVLSSLLIFISLVFILVLIYVVPIKILTSLGLLECVSVNNFYFFLSLSLGFIPLLFISNKSSSGDYSEWSKLLHRIVLNNYNISKKLFELDQWAARSDLKRAKETLVKRDKVYVTGLARAGTTAMTKQLHTTGLFHSLSYSNLPFLMAPRLWPKVHKSKNEDQKERAHGDKVMFGTKSVEALEEYFFKVMLKDSFIDDRRLKIHELNPEIYERYIVYQNLISSSNETIYLAKNNNLILRYSSLRRLDPGMKVVLMFREPNDHANSLLSQHNKFSELQREDPFVLDYMNWLAHHEFGLGHKPFSFDQDESTKPENKGALDYWLWQWCNYYEYVLSLMEDPCILLVEYQDFLMEPDSVLMKIQEFINIDFGEARIDRFDKIDPIRKAHYSEDNTRTDQILCKLRQFKMKIYSGDGRS